jgi:3-oxoacyl-[acyl-carrier-protein] synthase-3
MPERGAPDSMATANQNGANRNGASSNVARCRLASLLGVQVLATGSYVPETVVGNESLEASLGYEPGWIFQRTGIRERRHASPHQATSDLAFESARRCIERAGVSASEIDLLVVGTFTPDLLCPSTACQVQGRLGLNAPAMDVQAACAGFMYALVTAMQFVATGASKLALAIGADTNSRILNPRDQRTYPLFGDGAGAVLLSPGSPRQGLVSYTLGSDGSGYDLIHRPGGGSRLPATGPAFEKELHYMQMDGRAVFKWAIRMVNETANEVVRHAGLTLADVDLWAFHQANQRIIDAAAGGLQIDRQKIFVNLERYGNTSAASIPLVLDEAVEQGRIRRGDQVMLSGFGAGLAWGTGLLRF